MNKFTIAGIAFTSGLSTLAIAPMNSALASPLAQSTTSECGVPSTNYGEMFPDLAGASWAVDDLRALSEAMIAPADEPTSGVDPEDNRAIPAGYTYFGQFLDHDLTFDNRPDDLTTPTDPATLTNGRTPQLDLDSLYGTGPDGSAQLYASDHMHLLTGSILTGGNDRGARDLPRDPSGAAIIADPRNDENRIVAGIHSLFIRLHNKIVDRIVKREPRLSSSVVFARARREVTTAYQWMVVTDYLPRIVGQRNVDAVIRRRGNQWVTTLHQYTTCAAMPVEFSAAAYRFGHSQVRAFYRINGSTDLLPVFSGTFAAGSDLTGFSASPSTFGIDWNLFVPSRSNIAQASYRIDTSLTHSLSLLPLPTTGVGPANLALRNLLRGQQLGLPSGQDVARALGMTPLPDDQILIGAATGDPTDRRPITEISPNFAGSTPLWVYVLAEAAQLPSGRLGPVGGRLVAETVIGLLASDPSSILHRSAVRPSVSSLRNLIDAVR